MRRVELTAAEREVAKLIGDRCSEIVIRARAQAAQIMSAANVMANRTAERGQKKILELVRGRGVEIGSEEVVSPEFDHESKSTVALLIVSKDLPVDRKP